MSGLTKSVERTGAPLLRSAVGASLGVPRALHRPSRRRSLTPGVGRNRLSNRQVRCHICYEQYEDFID